MAVKTSVVAHGLPWRGRGYRPPLVGVALNPRVRKRHGLPDARPRHGTKRSQHPRHQRREVLDRRKLTRFPLLRKLGEFLEIGSLDSDWQKHEAILLRASNLFGGFIEHPR